MGRPLELIGVDKEGYCPPCPIYEATTATLKLTIALLLPQERGATYHSNNI